MATVWLLKDSDGRYLTEVTMDTEGMRPWVCDDRDGAHRFERPSYARRTIAALSALADDCADFRVVALKVKA